MIVETSLSLAKKLVRLERSMEQLSHSLAKHETPTDVSTAQEYSAVADKSSATSSVEDDGTRAEAWHILTSVLFHYSIFYNRISLILHFFQFQATF